MEQAKAAMNTMLSELDILNDQFAIIVFDKITKYWELPLRLIPAAYKVNQAKKYIRRLAVGDKGRYGVLQLRRLC